MSNGLIWQMLLHEAPADVFESLVQVGRRHHRLVAADAGEGWVVFNDPTADPMTDVPLRAVLQVWGTGTLVQVVSAGRPPRGATPAAAAAEAASIGSFVRQVRAQGALQGAG